VVAAARTPRQGDVQRVHGLKRLIQPRRCQSGCHLFSPTHMYSFLIRISPPYSRSLSPRCAVHGATAVPALVLQRGMAHSPRSPALHPA
jgi:hypothetical protein